MFGLGFTEILFVAIIAIIFLGPDKLPEAMVQIAKFFNSFKKTVSDAKSTFENEIHLNDLKQEALSYKRTIDNDISGFKNSLERPIDDLNEALSQIENEADITNYKNSQVAPKEPEKNTNKLEKPKKKPKTKEKIKKKKSKTEDDA